MTNADTIYALSSGPPPAAIAIIRISGPGALETLSRLSDVKAELRRATMAELRDGDEVLDHALVLRFDGPNTVTGEDLVELHLHGGRAVVAAVLRALAKQHRLRQAEPGEFTRRAFANGRIDLAEAEGLADLLAAETESQRRAALRVAGGALSRQVAAWTDRLLSLAAAVEAVLDFSDEGDVEEGLPPSWHRECGELVADIDSMLARPPVERLRDGVRVVIAGPPNSGKSTLLNALVGREAAIISELAGTTRDLIEAPVSIGGVPVVLIDSAGLRSAGDRIEAIGIDRAHEAIQAADLVLWLGAPEAAPPRSAVLKIRARADVDGPSTVADLSVSAVTGAGMEVLVSTLVAEAGALLPAENEVSINARQRAALAGAAGRLRAAEAEEDLLLVAEELRAARAALDLVTGRAGVENMLDALFGRFCIGK